MREGFGFNTELESSEKVIILSHEGLYILKMNQGCIEEEVEKWTSDFYKNHQIKVFKKVKE